MLHLIATLGFMFLGLTITNRVMEGQFTQLSDITLLNNIMVFNEISVFGLFTIPIPNMAFITEGLPALVNWEYTMFEGYGQFIQLFLYTLNLALGFLLFTLIIGLLYQYFGRAR